MKNVFKKIILIFLVAAIIFGSSPLSGFKGLEIPILRNFFITKAEAATYNGTCGTNLTWSLDEENNKLTINGTGAMTDYTSETAPWYSHCSIIKTVIISDDVTSIGNYAFINCTALESVTIGSNVTSIGTRTFAYCSSLESISFPDSVTTISSFAFRNCNSLINITFGKGITSIGDHAFRDCTALENITFPDSIVTINDYTFANCTSLKTVTINRVLKYINISAFYNCASLTDVYYTGCEDEWNAISISSNNESLLGATIHIAIRNVTWIVDGNKTVVEQSFGDEFIFPDEPIKEGYTFIGWTPEVPETVPDYDVEFTATWERNLITGTCGNNLTWSLSEQTGELIISGTGAMNNWTSYTYAPWYSEKSLIKKIIIKNGVTSIGNYAFNNCYYTTEITIPDTLTNIGYYSFNNCNSLSDVYFNGYGEKWNAITIESNNNKLNDATKHIIRKITWIVEGTETVVDYNCGDEIIIPEDPEKDGYSFVGWTPEIPDTMPDNDLEFTASWAKIMITGTCGENLTWTLNDETGELIISGTGAMFDWTSATAPWYNNRTLIKTVLIKDGVTSIGNYAFHNCSALESISIGKDVVRIGDCAFYICKLIENISLPESVTEIGTKAFYQCTALKQINIPEGVTTIKDSTFINCSALTGIVIPDSVTTIEKLAFTSCKALAEITIGNSITSIGERAFFNCTTLSDVIYNEYKENWDKITIGAYNEPLLNATFSYLLKHYVSWIVDGSETINSYNCGEEIVIPENPEKYGYTFAGWTPEVPATMPEYDIIFTATWTCYLETNICGENLTCTYNEKTGDLIISGTGAMYNWESPYETPWYFERNSIEKIIIENSITTIGNYAFYECSALTSIEIPDSVSTIGDYAFGYCRALESVTLSNSVETIGNNAFGECSALTNIEIPDSVSTIGDYAFGYCEALESVTLGNSVETIGNNAFYECSAMTSIVISDSVTAIGDYAFYKCESLESVTLGKNIETIGNYAFCGCYALTSVDIPDSVTTIGDSAFRYCEVLESVTLGKNIETIGNYAFCGCYALTSVDIPDSVTTIGDSAFVYCEALESVTLGNSVESIGNEAFYGCSALTSIVIPDSVSTIGDSAFEFCEALESVTLGNNIETIGNYAFCGCSALTSVDIPDSVTTIGDCAFFACESLTTITIGSGVTEIGVEAFISNLEFIAVDENNSVFSSDEYGVLFSKDKTVLIQYPLGNKRTNYKIPADVTIIDFAAFAFCYSITSIEIHDGVTTIGDCAFFACESLTTITIGSGVTEIGVEAFISNLEFIAVDENNSVFSSDEYGVLFNKNKTELIQYPIGNDRTSYKIPDSVTTIGDSAFEFCEALECVSLSNSIETIENYAFNGCSALTSIEIPDSVSTIGDDAFRYCEALESVTLGNNIETIGNYAFFGCSAIKNIEIPDSVTAIGEYAFGYCRALKNVTLGNNIETIGNYAFCECSALSKVYYAGTVNDWNAIDIGYNNSPLRDATIEYILSGTCGENLTWKLIRSKGILTISGTGEMDVWESSSSPWESDKASVKTVIINDGVTNISSAAFYDCNNLTSITIPDSVTTIGNSAFSSCDNLTSVTIPYGVTSINAHTFSWCERLSNITIPETVTSIHNSAFYSCSALTDINIPDSVTSIGNDAFHNCRKLTSVTIGNSVDSIGSCAFAYCISLTDIVIPDGIVNIGEGAFGNCDNLKTVTIPNSVTIIEDNAFNSCNNLSDVYYSGSKIKWNAITVGNGNNQLINATIHFSDRLIYWNIDGETLTQEYICGDIITPPDAHKDGCTFVKWIPEVPSTMPAEDLEFTAVFESNGYMVNWNIDGLIMTESYKFGDVIDKSKSFNKKGYSFVGWSPEIPDTMPAHNLEFFAIFEANLYEAKFYTNGGTFPDGNSIKTVLTAFNSAIVTPDNPVRSGYEFAGWAYNGKNIGTDLGIMDSISGKEFEAIWISTNTTSYKIEIYTMNTVGEYEVSSMLVNATAFEEITINPSVSEGFELNTEKSILNGIVYADETLVLKVYTDRKQYTFTTVINGIETSVLYYYGSILSEPVPPQMAGYIFTGWDAEIPASMPANNVRVTAEFKIAPQDKNAPRINIITPENRTIYYGESVILNAFVYNLPEGASIKWEVSGDGVSIKPLLDGKSCKVTSTSNGDVVIRAYIIDSKGNTVAGSDGKPVYDFEYLHSEVNFWLMIVRFIKQLFGVIK